MEEKAVAEAVRAVVAALQGAKVRLAAWAAAQAAVSVTEAATVVVVMEAVGVKVAARKAVAALLGLVSNALVNELLADPTAVVLRFSHPPALYFLKVSKALH